MATRSPQGRKKQAAPKPKVKKASKPSLQARSVEERTSTVLERGDLLFFYRPDVDETSPEGLLDVRRFHLVLRPEGKDILRLITVGRKQLPEAAEEGRSYWAFVERVFHSPDELRDTLDGARYETETLGERQLPRARPVGEGIYALARHGRSTVLAYALDLPKEMGEVQHAFHVEREGQFVISVKNPAADSPSGSGLEDSRRADFPEELLERFGDRRWTPAEPPEFLDYEGAELVLIGGREASDDLDMELDPHEDARAHAALLKALHLEKSDRTNRPLYEGVWE
ncbi:hypothetical protein [Singulisphaera sp. PoT]|uniref:hypothetical protein n=1 Tax=Singulisphaera sp. PoT TaxID=3411797 RepID=UPI003BF5BDB0